MIETVGQLGGRQAEALIRPFLGHGSERVQSAAAWVLYRFTGDESLTEVLLRLLKSANPILRQAALFDLAESGWLGGIEAVVTADVAVNLRVIALKRLYMVAVSDCSQEKSAQIQDLAQRVIPWMDQLF
ncbi:MAG: HEAT repeat domain-containing protein [Cyanophyceae cyanobacterium]